MEEFGKHLVGVVFWLATFALFAVLGWKFWHGQWLRLIAGNNLVSDEEQKSPFQRALGRRMGVVMLSVAVPLRRSPPPRSSRRREARRPGRCPTPWSRRA